jgi:hypothetical protein
MITIITVDNENHTLWARKIDADATSGDMVMLGTPGRKRIREMANQTFPAPDPIPNYNGYEVKWTE